MAKQRRSVNKKKKQQKKRKAPNKRMGMYDFLTKLLVKPKRRTYQRKPKEQPPPPKKVDFKEEEEKEEEEQPKKPFMKVIKNEDSDIRIFPRAAVAYDPQFDIRQIQQDLATVKAKAEIEPIRRNEIKEQILDKLKSTRNKVKGIRNVVDMLVGEERLNEDEINLIREQIEKLNREGRRRHAMVEGYDDDDDDDDGVDWAALQASLVPGPFIVDSANPLAPPSPPLLEGPSEAVVAPPLQEASEAAKELSKPQIKDAVDVFAEKAKGKDKEKDKEEEEPSLFHPLKPKKPSRVSYGDVHVEDKTEKTANNMRNNEALIRMLREDTSVHIGKKTSLINDIQNNAKGPPAPNYLKWYAIKEQQLLQEKFKSKSLDVIKAELGSNSSVFDRMPEVKKFVTEVATRVDSSKKLSDIRRSVDSYKRYIDRLETMVKNTSSV
jgi:hypothetical protein